MTHIGLDLDNTIIDYSQAFPAAGVRHGLLPEAEEIRSKNAAKAYLLAQPDGMRRWMRLQGLVYGPEIGMARLYKGVADCIHASVRAGHRLSIVSHKTERGHFDSMGANLREAALTFLGGTGLVGTQNPIAVRDVHFLSTCEAKVRRIRELGCDIFVDDLIEVLLHPEFPALTRPVWFAESGDHDELTICESWEQIRQTVINGAA